MRLVYFGSPPDAVPPLAALVAAGHDVALVVSQPDRKRGRGGALVPSAVKAAAEGLGLDVVTPGRAREIVERVAALDADLGVVVAFGQLLPVPLLESVRHGFVNLHFSLLPRWRGAAPVERAMLAGDAETGVDLMEMEEGLDTGGIYAEVRTAIHPHETAGELRRRLVDLGTALLVEHIGAVPGAQPRPQQGEATYAAKLSVEEFRLDPAADAETLARVVRAGNPRPGAWCTIGGKRLKVLSARAVPAPDAAQVGVIDAQAHLSCGHGALALEVVQPEGKAALDAAAWRRGLRGDLVVDPLPAEPTGATA